MSLDVWIELPSPIKIPKKGTGIFVRSEGRTVEVEFAAAIEEEETVVPFKANITHNLSKMAAEADLYQPLWHPEESGIATARDAIAPLSVGLFKLRENPFRFKALNPKNGWGSYKVLVSFVEQYLQACCQYPEAKIFVCR